MAKKAVVERSAPEPIRVKALQRGYYAFMEVIETRDVDGTRIRELGRNNVIRNEGEVFEYDLTDAPLVTSLQDHQRADRETVKSSRGDVALPRWVTLAGKREKETEAAGHTRTFGNMNAKKDDSVI